MSCEYGLLYWSGASQGILHRRKDPHERTKFQHSDPTQDKHKESDIHARLFPILARVASVTAVLMYVFYFPQIIGNINGHKGDWIQPLVAGINCTLWVAYGLWREKKDWPIVIANAPGIIFGGTAAITALM